MAFVPSVKGMYVLRFFIGVLEASSYPGISEHPFAAGMSPQPALTDPFAVPPLHPSLYPLLVVVRPVTSFSLSSSLLHGSLISIRLLPPLQYAR